MRHLLAESVYQTPRGSQAHPYGTPTTIVEPQGCQKGHILITVSI